MKDCFGCSSSSSDEDELLSPDEKANFTGPVKGRSRTDSSFLGIFLFVLVTLFGLIVYCTINGDTNRLFYGFDKCGDVCGVKNLKNPDPKFCAGKDMTNKPFLKIDAPFFNVVDLKYVERECVESCSQEKNFKEFLHRCIPKGNETVINDIFTDSSIGSFFQEIIQDLQHTKWEIIFLCIFAFIASLGLVCLLRFVPGIFVGFLLISAVAVSLSTTIFLWITWNQKSNIENKNEIQQRVTNLYLGWSLIGTKLTIVLLIIIVAMRKRIPLVVQLFKESGKAIQSMPLLLLQPMVTFFLICLSIVIWSYFAVLIQSSGFLALEPQGQNAYYKKDQLMKFARVYNILVLMWVIEFITGCQHMIIAGSVATWFFTRNKDNVSQPISTSIGYLFKYHLGTIAMGSFVLTVVQIINAILHSMERSMKKSNHIVVRVFYIAFKCLFDYIQLFIQFLTRNAYIEVAIYGADFCRSGQRAFKVIGSNIVRVFAINSLGDYVLLLGKVLVVTLTVLLGFEMLENKPGILHWWVPLTVVGIFAYFMAHCFISVYEMVIDTIFICFCEDCNLNDGDPQEYYMSKELMEFVENSKKVLKVSDGANN